MIKLFRQYYSLRKMLFILGEGALIYASVTAANYVLLGMELDLGELLLINWWRILIVMVVAQVSLYFNDLYAMKNADNLVELATLLIQAVGVTTILLAVIYFFWQEAMLGRWIFLVSIVFLVLLLVSWRLLYSYVIHKKLFAEKTLIIGASGLARDVLREITSRRDISYDVRALIVSHQNEEIKGEEVGIPVRVGFDDLCSFAEANEVSSIIVALEQKRGVMPCKELLNCKIRGINIIDGESFYERITGKLLVEQIRPSWLIFSDGFIKSGVSRFTKRLVGFLLSVVMFVLLAPMLLVVALAIKLDSRGPVLFKQERVGEFGQEFMIYKFRSMRADAEKFSGPVWAEEDDPRITRIGRIIRKLRIDELPQLWNVLKGEMSFVGPRPERAFFVEKLKKTIPYYNERFSVKPGVTGWAQIKYPYGSTEQDALEKLKYDLYYIKNMSVVMDLMIIFQTVKTVLLRRGSR